MNVGLTNLHRLQFLARGAMFNFIQDENSKIFKICTVFSFLDRAH